MTTATAWWLIFAVLAFVVVLSVVFFRTWHSGAEVYHGEGATGGTDVHGAREQKGAENEV